MQMHYADARRDRAVVRYGERVLPSVGSWWREATVVAAVFALCLLGGALQVDDTVALPGATAYLVAAVSSATLLVRRKAPLATLAAATACGMLVTPLGLLLTPLTVAAVAVAAWSFGRRTERRTTPVALPAAALLVVVTPFLESDFSWADISRLVTVAATPLVAVALGRSARHRRAYLAVVEERAQRAEETKESEARRKVAEERVRIARELHDLVAHQITLANAQASVAAHLFDTRPDQARASLDELVGTTRQALDELRATVGLLRQHDDGSGSTEPAPGLTQLPALVESMRGAGLAVSVRYEGDPGPLPPAVDLTAFRIVQESLTNVTKHSAADRAEVCVARDPERLVITITDEGGAPMSPQPPPGFGLVGLRERAAAVGGDLTAGPRPGGGFVVTGRLPLAAATTARTPAPATHSEDR